jgi:uncharacterized OB-fold protein
VNEVSAPTYDKFLPEGIPDWQMPFWASLRRRRPQVQRCDDCGRFRYVPKERCPACFSPRASWQAISGQGEVYTYSVVYRGPTPAYQADVPYVIAHVTMAEGFRMAGSLRGLAPEAVRIGLPVRLAYEDATPEWTLFYFEPAPEAGG